MVVVPGYTIAVKCSECGRYKVFDVDMFKLKISTNIMCSCSKKIINAWIKKGEIYLDINCIVCDRIHSYKFKLKEVIYEKPLTILSCPQTGMEIAFIGKADRVNGLVERYMGDMYELLEYLGVFEKPVSN